MWHLTPLTIGCNCTLFSHFVKYIALISGVFSVIWYPSGTHSGIYSISLLYVGWLELLVFTVQTVRQIALGLFITP